MLNAQQVKLFSLYEITFSGSDYLKDELKSIKNSSYLPNSTIYLMIAKRESDLGSVTLVEVG